MIKIGYLFDRIRDVKLSDYLSFFPMTAALIIKPFYRNKYVGTWLVCEEPGEARDNGYHFFKYMCEKQPQQKCFYAIKKSSVDVKKVQSLGEIIEYGSVQHWLAYFLCEYNISSQKGGKPNAATCAFMEMNGIFKPKNVFLQHGITKDHAEWLYADKCNFKYFITAAIPEDDMIRKDYGFPDGIVQLCGFPRYDALESSKTKKNRILVMPTWRYWFNLKSKYGEGVERDFTKSEYLHKWLEFLNSEYLDQLIDKYDLNVVFFLHRNMQRYIDSFRNVNKKITIASWKEYDIQNLLMTSALMVTDYSSVYFDMIYMKKPVIFYQFDEKIYRKYQYQEGWFDYHNNPFGKSIDNPTGIIKEIRKYLESSMSVGNDYIDGYNLLFKYHDNDNSHRLFSLLSKERL